MVELSEYSDNGTQKSLKGENVTRRSVSVSRHLKSAFDRIVAALLLVALAPAFLVIASAIKVDSRGPVFYRQLRNGKNLATFTMWKFRSMGAEESSATPTFKQATKNDARVTKVGAFLRKTSLDELPQLFNVVFGDMSLVGPRPHPIPLDDQFRSTINDFDVRYSVVPGITGLAQVKGFRGETDTHEKMLDRVMADIDYAGRWSLWLDVRILLATMLMGFINPNAY